MRRGVVVAVLLAVAFAPAAAAPAAETQKPRLTLVATVPLTVAANGFRGRERVVVVTRVGEERETVRRSASSSGRFRAVFSDGPRIDRCLGAFVSAVGSRGSRASLKLPQPACPPRL